MKGLKTTYERKSAVLTVLIMSAVIAALFFIGMRYMDPPEEYGVAVNFGNVDFGQGPPVEQNQTSPEPEPNPVVEEAQESTPPPSEEVIEEEIITSDEADAALVAAEQEAKAKAAAEEKERQEKLEQERKKAELDALMGGLNSGKSSSEGDDDKQGLKGKTNGDPNAKDYYASGGTDSDGNYRLAGRKVLKKPIYSANCEEGIIVVRIEVDQNGNVLKATPGVKGSTSQEPCLMEPAKKAAMETKFNVDPKANNVQVGTIVYEFKATINQ